MLPATAAIGNASDDVVRTAALLFVVDDTVDDAVVTFVTPARLASDADDNNVLSLDTLLSVLATVDVTKSAVVNCALLTPTDVGTTIARGVNVPTGKDPGAVVSENAADAVVAVVIAVVGAIVVVAVVASVATADAIEFNSVIIAVDVGDCVGHVAACRLQVHFAGHDDAA